MIENIFIITAVAGATEILRRLKDKDYWAAATITAAGVIGTLAGVFSVDGISVTNGLIAGLSASGLIVIADRVGVTVQKAPTSKK